MNFKDMNPEDRKYAIDLAIDEALEDRWTDEPVEPSFEWDLENFAGARSNLINGTANDGAEQVSAIVDFFNAEATLAGLRGRK